MLYLIIKQILIIYGKLCSLSLQRNATNDLSNKWDEIQLNNCKNQMHKIKLYEFVRNRTKWLSISEFLGFKPDLSYNFYVNLWTKVFFIFSFIFLKFDIGL